MKDWRGTEIEVGDTIVYVVKESTRAITHEATVTLSNKLTESIRAKWSNSSMYSSYRRNKNVWLTHPENITVIKKAIKHGTDATYMGGCRCGRCNAHARGLGFPIAGPPR